MTLRRNIIISACFAALVPVIQAIPRQYNVVQRESLPIAREHNVAQRASVPVATTVPSNLNFAGRAPDPVVTPAAVARARPRQAGDPAFTSAQNYLTSCYNSCTASIQKDFVASRSAIDKYCDNYGHTPGDAACFCGIYEDNGNAVTASASNCVISSCTALPPTATANNIDIPGFISNQINALQVTCAVDINPIAFTNSPQISASSSAVAAPTSSPLTSATSSSSSSIPSPSVSSSGTTIVSSFSSSSSSSSSFSTSSAAPAASTTSSKSGANPLAVSWTHGMLGSGVLGLVAMGVVFLL